LRPMSLAHGIPSMASGVAAGIVPADAVNMLQS
jgi:hypothetical protein